MSTKLDKHAWVDLHSHVLPNMDDGSRSVEESMEMLKTMVLQGIQGVAATPHYYPTESVAEFLARREKHVRELKLGIEAAGAEVPQLILGAETAYREGISKEPELEALCYGHSRYLLLEMPFDRWDEGELRDLERMSASRGIIPIIAHFERYEKFQSREMIRRVMELDVLIQMNCEVVSDFWSFMAAKRKLRNGSVHILGSDCHNLTKRPPNMGTAIEKMKAKGLLADLEEIRQYNLRVFMESMN